MCIEICGVNLQFSLHTSDGSSKTFSGTQSRYLRFGIFARTFPLKLMYSLSHLNTKMHLAMAACYLSLLLCPVKRTCRTVAVFLRPPYSEMFFAMGEKQPKRKGKRKMWLPNWNVPSMLCSPKLSLRTIYYVEESIRQKKTYGVISNCW